MTEKEALIKLEESLRNLNSTTMGRRMFLASTSLLLAACATGEQHRKREGNLIGNETDLTVNDERKMTQEVLPQMRKDYPALQNNEIQSYISNLGRKIVLSNNLEGHPYNYNFTVVDVPHVNAFALPAGTVFVTAPLIAMADNEAELAGVIGHEVGHIKARHTAQRMTKAKQEQGKTSWYAGGGALIGGVLGYGASKLLCKPEDNECIQKSVGYGLAAGAAGGLLVQKYKFMANSREDEMEADRIGFKTSVTSNFHKDHSGRFYQKLLTMEQQGKGAADPLTRSLADALSTHPPSQERVNQMNILAAETSQNLSKAIINSTQFDRVKKICQQVVDRQKQKKQS